MPQRAPVTAGRTLTRRHPDRGERRTCAPRRAPTSVGRRALKNLKHAAGGARKSRGESTGVSGADDGEEEDSGGDDDDNSLGVDGFVEDEDTEESEPNEVTANFSLFTRVENPRFRLSNWLFKLNQALFNSRLAIEILLYFINNNLCHLQLRLESPASYMRRKNNIFF